MKIFQIIILIVIFLVIYNFLRKEYREAYNLDKINNEYIIANETEIWNRIGLKIINRHKNWQDGAAISYILQSSNAFYKGKLLLDGTNVIILEINKE